MEKIRHSPALSFLVTCAALVIVIAGMGASASLLAPLLLAVFVAVLTASPMFFLRERGLSTGVALLVLLGALVGGSLNDLSTNLPGYEASLKEQARDLRLWLEGNGVSLLKAED